ncbi:MAG: 3-dehydroquinate synthase [Dehalococcoidia bacterium]|nr:3-dehydroquinate synthase [Dehalococcoidia bacterium]
MATLRPSCEVVTGAARYPIYVEPGCLDSLGALLAERSQARRAFIVSDEVVAQAWGPRALESCRTHGLMAELLTIPVGEEAKSLDGAAKLYDALVEARAERRDVIVALGGGVVGDLAGFVAATYLRGVPFVQVPTSLLAMADAAIGGKTGVNHTRGKNLIGAFYQPLFVLEDPDTLATMPAREFREGWAEIIKHGLIRDADLTEQLAEDIQALQARDPAALTAILSASAAVKATIVSADERESDGRMWLNYGHTVGHAIEAAAGYGRYLHGEAVAVGMLAAATVGERMGLLNSTAVALHFDLVEAYGLPTEVDGLATDAVMEAMTLDKKAQAGTQRWVLLEGLGNPVVRKDVPADVVTEALAEVGID